MVNWWPGEGSGRDIVGDNDGTLFNVTYTNGEVRQAFAFNGTDSYVLVPSSANLSPTGSVSVQSGVLNLTHSNTYSGSFANCRPPWRAG